jgi:iron uptake system component EfeO
MRARALTALTVPALVLGLTACGGSSEAGDDAGGGPITVTASDTTCEVSRTEAPAGTIEFTVTNTGSKVNEFYVYAEGDRVVGEVENIAPGLTRTFQVEVTEPGTYETACKPGMAGKGIRAPFTVTGSSAAPTAEDSKVTSATQSYERFVASEADALLARTTEFVALVKAGQVAQAKALYPVARSHWERIEPVAESFGDLDPKIDGREDVVEEGMAFTGYHRLEKDLWVDGLRPDSAKVADQLLTDVGALVARAKTVELNGLQLANGSKALLDEMATGKITGEEERYSHTDLWDFAANWEGSKAAVAALRPVLQERAPELVASYDTRATALDALIASHREGDGYVLYPELGEAQVKALSDALDAVSEDVAKVAGVVASA